MPYVKASEAARYFNVSISTIRRYARNSDIRTEKLPTGRYKYWINDSNEDNRITYLYARVSCRKQYNDLQRQISFLRRNVPNTPILSDIGSGINYDRKNFKTILQQLIQGKIKKVVVAHKDRFSRIGFSFFQWLFQQFRSELISLDTKQFSKTTGNEMLDDIMEIITVFTARYYGLRKYRKTNRKSSKM
jgi:predicted site-specific integrase-resolvase